ncbi:MAG: autotransporter-associated beta strand repeat-containing protein, partial [Verrucomicrobiae bacterium]|nr:autotransporter-associated beta strand repeat-containing protein [Verrucomicrobiae bacterium]
MTRWAVALVVSWVAGTLALAQTTYTWTLAGNGNWGTAANWTPNTDYPKAGDTAVFSAGTGRTITIDADHACANLTVTGAGAWTWSGAPNKLTISGVFDYSGTGNSTFSAILAGSGSVTKNVGTASVLTLSGLNTYSGNTTINAGRLYFGSSSDAYPPTQGPVGRGTLILKDGTAISTADTTARTIHNPITIDGNVTIGWCTGLYVPELAGPITLTGNRTMTFAGPASGIISGSINDGGNGYRLTMAGGAPMNLRGQHTYSGGTVLNRPGVQTRIGSDTTGDPPTSGPLGTGPVSMLEGLQLMTEGATSRTLSNVFSLDGNISLGAGTSHYGILTFTRPWLLTGNRILTMAQNDTWYMLLQGGITDSGNNYELILRGYAGWIHFGGSVQVGNGITVWDCVPALNSGTTFTGTPRITLLDNNATVRLENAVGVNNTGPEVIFGKSCPILWARGVASGGIWTFPKLTRTHRAVLLVAGGTGSGKTPGGALTANDKIKVTQAPSVVNGMVEPYFIEYSGDFLTYDGAGNGFKRVTYSPSTDINTAGSTAIFTATALQTLTANREVYALRAGNAAGIAGAFDLTLGSGGLIVNASQTIVPNLQFGAKEGLIWVGSGFTGTMNGQFKGSNGVTVSGPGTLILNADSSATLTGQITLNGGLNAAGIVRLGASNVLPASQPLRINGSTLDLNGFNQTINNLTMAAGAVYVTAGNSTLTLGPAVTYDGTYRPALLYPNTGGPTLTVNLVGTTTFDIADGYNSTGNSYEPDMAFGANVASVWRPVTLAGVGPVNKKGPGFLQLAGDNTFTGDINVEEGILHGVLTGNGTRPFGNINNQINLSRNGLASFGSTVGAAYSTTLAHTIRFSGANGLRFRTGSSTGFSITLAAPAVLERVPGTRGTLQLLSHAVSGANDYLTSNDNLYVLQWMAPNPNPMVNNMLPAYFVHSGFDTSTYEQGIGSHVNVNTANGQIRNHTYTHASFAGATADSTVNLAADAGIGADQEIYALRTSANVTVSAGDPTLTIGSGGLIINADKTISPKLRFFRTALGKDVEALIYVAGINPASTGTRVTRTGTLAGRITTSVGLTKFGYGIL